MTTTEAPNAWCLHHSSESFDFIEGPFATKEEAEANAAEDKQKDATQTIQVLELVNPANC